MSTKKITLIVLEPGAENGADADADLPPEDFAPEGLKDLRAKLLGKERNVDLGTLKERMGDVQGQVEELLSGIKESAGGYRLSEVQVALAISGSGSIGVATVGAEASIALTFARQESGKSPA